MENEFWIDIKGYENQYQISNFGKIKSLDRIVIDKNGRRMIYKGKILSPIKSNRKNNYYLFVILKRKINYIHRLIAENFIENPNKYQVVDHINEDTTDNRIENLQWVTMEYNTYKSHIGKKHSEEVKQKMRGRKFSEETLQKMSLSMIGKNKGKPSPYKNKKCCMTRDDKGRFLRKFENSL